jgi:hypothetical protein
VNNQNALPGPCVIGGVGGSGTRVVAEILKQMGCYMGSNLNFANDNKGFAELFFRREWYTNFTRMEEELFYSKLKGFEQAALHSLQCDSPSSIGWGWKNPPTHIYLDYLSHYFPHLKYILVIRNGLDMAYSNNQNQLHNLGNFFHIDIPESENLLPKASLEYWIKANTRAIELGRNLLGKRFYVLKYESLCRNPDKEIRRLIDFLNPSLSSISNIEELCTLVTKPETIGRYKRKDLHVFSEMDMLSVRKLGFSIDRKYFP